MRCEWDGYSRVWRWLPPASSAVLALLLAACGSQAVREAPEPAPVVIPPGANAPAPVTKKVIKPAPAYSLKKGGGFYKDDGPGDNPPEDLDAIPDAVPRQEPLHRFANNPYSVMGKDYVPMKSSVGYKVQGIASWYGRKFHGQKTSSGEPYDMYGMTAAHPTLPIPSYARVSNPANGQSVVVRVNDRGPFHADRVMDLSYTAAWKLGLVGNGSGFVILEAGQAGDVLPLAVVKEKPADTDPIAQLARREEAKPAQLPAPAAAVSPTAMPAADTHGTFIQLGAFGNPDNAEIFRNHMGRDLDWLADKLRIEVAGKIHRVQVGPFPSRGEAEAVANRIASLLGGKPTFVVR